MPGQPMSVRKAEALTAVSITPITIPEWGKVNIAVTSDGGKMKLTKTPVPEMPEELKQLFVKKEAAHA